MNLLHLVRMAKWVRHPPSAARVKLVLGIVAVCLGLYAVERWVGWPELLSLQETRAPMRVSP